jgi:hypothetical protein
MLTPPVCSVKAWLVYGAMITSPRFSALIVKTATLSSPLSTASLLSALSPRAPSASSVTTCHLLSVAATSVPLSPLLPCHHLSRLSPLSKRSLLPQLRPLPHPVTTLPPPCHHPVTTLSPPCHHPVTTLSPPCHHLSPPVTTVTTVTTCHHRLSLSNHCQQRQSQTDNTQRHVCLRVCGHVFLFELMCVCPCVNKSVRLQTPSVTSDSPVADTACLCLCGFWCCNEQVNEDVTVIRDAC